MPSLSKLEMTPNIGLNLTIEFPPDMVELTIHKWIQFDLKVLPLRCVNLNTLCLTNIDSVE